MPPRYCPQCRSEYRPGFETCADCDVPLVDELPTVDSLPSGEAGIRERLPGLVTIATFDNPARAEILATRLEAEGIEAFLNDVQGVTFNPISGVKVQVRKGDAPKALEAIREKETPQPEDPEDPRRACPRCGSRKTYQEKISGRSAALSILMLGFPLLFATKEWKCSKCCRTFE